MHRQHSGSCAGGAAEDGHVLRSRLQRQQYLDSLGPLRSHLSKVVLESIVIMSWTAWLLLLGLGVLAESQQQQCSRGHPSLGHRQCSYQRREHQVRPCVPGYVECLCPCFFAEPYS